MKITKFGHALFTIEKDGQSVVIDPGNLSPDFTPPSNVVAIIITHAHGDHFDKELIHSIAERNPNVVIIGNTDVTSQVEGSTTKTVKANETITVGEFTLVFLGGEHQPIHHSASAGSNLGVIINDLIYYPGDSFTLPDRPIDTLALPVSGPWLKTGEVIDFLLAIKPAKAFPVHEALNSESARDLYLQVLKRFIGDLHTEIISLKSGESLEVAD